MTNEPSDLWNIEHKLVEEGYLDSVELWGINSGHEDFQPLADTSKLQLGESGEDSARGWGSRSAPSSGVRSR
jgi:hypothetical protein